MPLDRCGWTIESRFPLFGQMHDLILGTAGHIDHGKTSLVRALTGVDCDRLPDEKRRGITIDLGFAELPLGEVRLGIVDVPGHERFVRNMLAGATGIDLALLAVAADDSVKQQTREHVDILRLLSLRWGVIALTKCDLCEPSWLEMVEAEIRELTADTFLANAPIIHTSVVTGLGMEALKEALLACSLQAIAERSTTRSSVPFRMAIDRAFTIPGHGTVVTGSVSGGCAVVGDLLAIEPGHLEARVRALHNHDRATDRVGRGQRAAINLAGVHHEEIRRGQEIATPGHLVPSKIFSAHVTMLPRLAHPLKHRARVRLHLGTTEILANVSLLGRERLEAGESGPAQFFLAEPAVATWNQPFILRSESPVATLGGGRVLAPYATRIRDANERVLAMLADLGSEDSATRAAAAIYFRGQESWQPSELAALAGADGPETLCAQLLREGKLVEVAISPSRTEWIHALHVEEMGERIAGHLEKLHRQNPLKLAFPETRLRSDLEYLGHAGLMTVALARLSSSGRVRRIVGGLALTGQGPKLSQNEQKLLEQLIERFRLAGFKPPSVEKCRNEATRNREAVPQLIALAVGNGDLIMIGPDFHLHADHEKRVREVVGARLATEPGLTVSQIREMLDTSRKYAVPLCEYLDRLGFTRRQGDLRVLAAP